MTTVVDRPSNGQLWSTMPGWGIVADLTPPELIEARRLGTLRKMIVIGLAVIVLLVAAGYTLATFKKSSASDLAANANTQTVQLQQSVDKYAGITQIEGTTAQLDSQIASLMATDVDMGQLVGNIRAALPHTMAIDNMSVTVMPPTAFPAGTEVAAGLQQIGTVTVAGSGRSLDDLPAYVDSLSKITGVTGVVPLSNTQEPSGIHYTVTFSLDSRLYNPGLATSTTGGK